MVKRRKYEKKYNQSYYLTFSGCFITPDHTFENYLLITPKNNDVETGYWMHISTSVLVTCNAVVVIYRMDATAQNLR